MPDHPDHEQLAAFQAGDSDRRQRTDVEAHLAGCPSCAEVVASVERARSGLALLEQPELPPGLHDRLAAAVAGEATRVLPHRPTPWYRRPVALGAAAALLLAALVVPLLNQTSGDLTTAGGATDDQAQEAAGAPGAAAGAELPVIRVPGEVSAAVVLSRLADDELAKQALDQASAEARSSGGDTAAPRDSQGPATATQVPGQGQEDAYRSGTPPSPAAGATTVQQACLAAAAAASDPAIRPLVPAFYVEGTYQGRQATVLVTTSTGQPGRTDLWVFPRGNCSAAPLATERVR